MEQAGYWDQKGSLGANYLMPWNMRATRTAAGLNKEGNLNYCPLRELWRTDPECVQLMQLLLTMGFGYIMEPLQQYTDDVRASLTNKNTFLTLEALKLCAEHFMAATAESDIGIGGLAFLKLYEPFDAPEFAHFSARLRIVIATNKEATQAAVLRDVLEYAPPLGGILLARSLTTLIERTPTTVSHGSSAFGLSEEHSRAPPSLSTTFVSSVSPGRLSHAALPHVSSWPSAEGGIPSFALQFDFVSGVGACRDVRSLLKYFIGVVKPLNEAYGDGASCGNGVNIKRGEGWRSAKRHYSGTRITDVYCKYNVAFKIFEATSPEAIEEMLSRLEGDFNM